ncbi:MAG: hypothetical protein JJT94_09370 [Bernardetiaceae bacterium]|nr:hypothetical protein [Bernardetiaceae bacterium]
MNSNTTKYTASITVLIFLFLFAYCQKKEPNNLSENSEDWETKLSTILHFEYTPAEKISLKALQDSADAYLVKEDVQTASMLYKRLEEAAKQQNAIKLKAHAILMNAILYENRSSNISYIAQLLELWQQVNQPEFDKLPQLDSLKGQVLQNIAALFYGEKDFENAMLYFQKQAKLEVKSKGDTSDVVKNNIASTLIELGKSKEAYQILYPLIKENIEAGTIDKILPQYYNYRKAALQEADKGNKVEAFHLPKEYLYNANRKRLNQSNRIFKKYNYYSINHAHYMFLMDLENDNNLKIKYIDSAIQSIDSIVVYYSFLWQESKLDLLSTKMNFLLENRFGNDSSLIKVFESYNRHKKNIFNQNQLVFKNSLEQNQKLREKEKDYLITIHKQAQLQSIIIIAALIAAIILIIALFFYREWRLSMRKRQNLEAQLAVHLQEYEENIAEKNSIQTEKQKITDLYKNKVREEEELKIELERMEAKLLFQDALIERKKQTIKTIQKNLKQQEGIPKIINQIKREIKREDDIELELIKITDSIENLYPGIFIKLREQYPFLSTKELNVCALSLIDLSNKEIASLVSLSAKGLETLKYRLKKKLELSTEQDLKIFLIENFK